MYKYDSKTIKESFRSLNAMNHTFKKLNCSVLIIILISLNTFSQSNSKNESVIQGKLHLDSIWKPVVYLSHIPTFKEMYTMSREMIFAETNIDSLGYFKFSLKDFPEQDNFYRLHISKKGAPAASLIIGGKEENHIFFIANNKENINIKNTENGLFKPYQINGYSPNNSLQKVDSIINHVEEHDYSLVKKEFITKTIYDKLRHVADTSNHSIVSLYALHHSKFESTFLSNQNFYKNYLDKWKDENSTYFQELRTKLPKEENSNAMIFLAIGISFFILGFVFNYQFNLKRKQKNNKLKLLSVQERKILKLLKEGKSNKEISEEYNIGMSTVKSHVSSIYCKLNLKSRKEVMDI